MKNKKKKLPYLTNLISKLAPRVGAKVVVEPEWGYAAQIIYPNKVVRSLRFYSLDLNTIGSSDIAKDKSFAKFFIKKLGIKVAKGETIFAENWAKIIGSKRVADFARKYAKRLGYPVIVKPNSMSQGTGVSLVSNEKELMLALKEIFKFDRVAIVEEYMPGRDYRLVVLDGEIISAYERIPLYVVGDGRTSVLNLLLKKQKQFLSKGRDTKINLKDRRIQTKLKQQSLSFKSILAKNQKVFLLDNANLSTGGDSVDVTKIANQGFKKMAIHLTKSMGLRMCGVDIMVTTGDISMDPRTCEYFVIEINSSPGLDHYVTFGKTQRKIVEAMYLKILQALGNKNSN